MNYSIKAFIISFLIHISLFATFIEFQPQQKEKKRIIILNMNMVNEITQIKKQIEKKEPINTKKEKKQIEKKEEKKIKKKIKKKPKTIKKTPLPKKENKPKKINKIQKIKEQKIIKKEENIKRIKSGENYQEKYIKTNLANIIATIKKYKNYPYKAKKNRMEGKVLIRCTIKADGKIKNITIVKKSNFKILDENSIKILELASKEFNAPKKDITLTIPFNYYLN